MPFDNHGDTSFCRIDGPRQWVKDRSFPLSVFSFVRSEADRQLTAPKSSNLTLL